ncbi:hypothetical protein [Candidatus Ichthyocystis hellenicum]|uniref:hypothetical protein n=1 Tax=Candidatus Ichthyocystis hellenicum TaxID=1561003 RepID=UPI000B831629|nr:hypothetical protein [Candidatus Ichthyocystis hellenicum]
MPITSPFSISAVAIEGPIAAVSSHFRGPKKSFIMQFKGPFEVSTTSYVAAGPFLSSSSFVSMSSIDVAGPFFFLLCTCGCW